MRYLFPKVPPLAPWPQWSGWPVQNPMYKLSFLVIRYCYLSWHTLNIQTETCQTKTTVSAVVSTDETTRYQTAQFRWFSCQFPEACTGFQGGTRCNLSTHFKQRRSTCNCPASRTTLVATRFRVAVICPIIQVPHCIRVFFYFVWFVFINHIFQFYYELCTYCNIFDIYLS